MIYSEQKDEILVGLTLLGNQDAYEALVIRHQRAVLAAARSVTRSEPLAEDAAQDAFVSAWLKLSALKDASKYKTWVCNIAKNRGRDLLMQFHEWVDVDWLSMMEAENGYTPEYFIDTSDENSTLHENVNALTEKVRTVINLHYFEGYSVAEIAQKLSLPEGTVKARLHEGRKKLRKEYGLMNEKETDTLVRKVMKKVEELKLWRLKDNKEGFEVVWRETKSAIEALPDCTEKDYAMADTLQLGYWWVKGERNDDILAEMKEYAIRSKNEDVLTCVFANAHNNIEGDERITLIKEKQIPEMESLGFKKVQGYLWFWLGYYLLDEDRSGEALNAFKKVLELLEPSDVYYPCAISALKTEELGDAKTDGLTVMSEEYRYINGELRFWSEPGYGRGVWTHSYPAIGYYAAQCSNYFRVKGLRCGESIKSETGEITLTFQSASETAETPAGIFEGCEVWTVTAPHREIHTYYKDGIGIVKQTKMDYPNYDEWLLSDYNIKGGNGMMPLATGNSWNYLPKDYDPEKTKFISHREVTYADDKKAVLMDYTVAARLKYDENDWYETLLELKAEWNDYDESEDKDHYNDVTELLSRIKRLADTPVKKMVADGISDVMLRLMAGEERLHASPTHQNLLNRFEVCEIIDGCKLDDMRQQYRFNNNNVNFSDWTPGTWEERHKVLYNNIYALLYDTVNTLWSDRWVPGESYETEPCLKYYRKIKCKVDVSDGGRITTPAGTFENCICVHIEPNGYNGYWFGDRKEYYFAPGVGIVKTVHHYGNKGEIEAVYELTRYVGECEGYLSFADGMERTFEAQDTHDGYVGKSEYKFVRDEEGRLLVLSDLTGIKKLK